MNIHSINYTVAAIILNIYVINTKLLKTAKGTQALRTRFPSFASQNSPFQESGLQERAAPT